MAIGESLNRLWIVEKSLQARNHGEIAEQAPRLVLCRESGLLACFEWTAREVSIVCRVCDTGIGAAVVPLGLHAGEECDAMDHHPV
jgi:hypothetical protein